MQRQAGRGRRRAQPKRRAQPTRPRRTPFQTAVGAFGELLLTGGGLVLLFVLYTLFGTGIQTAAAQDNLAAQTANWGQGAAEKPALPPAETPVGDAYAIMTIPRFGDSWEWTVVQGVEDDDLKNGPGHYLDSANPGEVGNFSIAAHRSGHGEPFAQFAELRVGDTIKIRNSVGTFIYQIDSAPDGDADGNKINIKDSWVVDPVPGEADDVAPTERRITLTTCWPRFGSSHRMYATGILVGGEEL